jgi:hypothetical protein
MRMGAAPPSSAPKSLLAASGESESEAICPDLMAREGNLAAAASVERLDARRTHAAPEWPAPSHTPPATYSYGHLATRI